MPGTECAVDSAISILRVLSRKLVFCHAIGALRNTYFAAEPPQPHPDYTLKPIVDANLSPKRSFATLTGSLLNILLMQMAAKRAASISPQTLGILIPSPTCCWGEKRKISESDVFNFQPSDPHTNAKSKRKSGLEEHTEDGRIC